jgi:hypothetical protein
MFGLEIYSINISSKADGYSANTDRNIQTRVIIVNHVDLEQWKITHEALQEIQHAPLWFNSH